jgi:hypothetical protein
MPKRRRWFWLKVLLAGISVAVVAAIAQVAWIELRCVGTPAAAEAAYQPILEPAYRRSEINTYLTYPEWSIVHAYEDFAGVVRAKGESDFAYFSSIHGFWSNLCAMTSHASARGNIDFDVKAMLYIIGLSFAAEMGVKGAYELTIGWATEAIRGEKRTPEDRFALAVAEDYAKFLQQTPWYAYPFGSTLGRFWSEVAWSEGNLLRKLERRFSLTLEYGVKALYARAIGALAGIAPAALRIRTVVRGLDDSDLAADPRIQRIEVRPDGTAVIETPRYRELTEILGRLASRGRDVVEIAGNDDIFVTLLMPPGAPPAKGELLITVPSQARPGWRRDGLAIKVSGLAQLMRILGGSGAQFEHAYDY